MKLLGRVIIDDARVVIQVRVAAIVADGRRCDGDCSRAVSTHAHRLIKLILRFPSSLVGSE